MINALGSLSLVWLMLWLLLAVGFSLIYPLFRPLFMRLHPAHGSNLVLLYWSAPVVLAFIASLMLFSPMSENLLVSPHCHGSCVQHSPQTGELPVALFGLVLAALLTAGLCISFLVDLLRGARVRCQLEALASEQKGYSLLDASDPAVFTLGWWKPVVFVSKGLLQQCSSEHVSVILQHEQAHRSRRDNLRLLLVRVFSVGLPFRLRQSAVQDARILCEQACDFAAAAKHDPITVAETLVHVGRLVTNTTRPKSSMAFASADLPIRVNALLCSEGRKKLSVWQLAMVVVMLLIVLLSALDPLHHAAEWFIALLDSAGGHNH